MTTAAEIAARYGATVAPGCVVHECEVGATSEVAVDYRYSSRTGRIDAVTPAMERRAKFLTPERAAHIAARRQRAAEMARAGMINKQIAAALGVTRHTVHNDLIATGVVTVKPTAGKVARDDHGSRTDMRDGAQVLRAFWFGKLGRVKPLSGAELCDRLKIARIRDIEATLSDLVARGMLTRARVHSTSVFEVTARGEAMLRNAAGAAQ